MVASSPILENPLLNFHHFRDAADSNIGGHCFRVKGEAVEKPVRIFFSDEFLDDRMNRNLSQFLVEECDFILDQIRSGYTTIKVMNSGIVQEK